MAEGDGEHPEAGARGDRGARRANAPVLHLLLQERGLVRFRGGPVDSRQLHLATGISVRYPDGADPDAHPERAPYVHMVVHEALLHQHPRHRGQRRDQPEVPVRSALQDRIGKFRHSVDLSNPGASRHARRVGLEHRHPGAEGPDQRPAVDEAPVKGG